MISLFIKLNYGAILRLKYYSSLATSSGVIEVISLIILFNIGPKFVAIAAS